MVGGILDGGERLLQKVKCSIRKLLEENKLTYEELRSAVVEMEGILNPRPLLRFNRYCYYTIAFNLWKESSNRNSCR